MAQACFLFPPFDALRQASVTPMLTAAYNKFRLRTLINSMNTYPYTMASIAPRKRAFTPKVRTGCLTCKNETSCLYQLMLTTTRQVRQYSGHALLPDEFMNRNGHVKCDEARPHCVRCQKLNLKCYGFPLDSQALNKSTALTTKDRPLLPKVLDTKRLGTEIRLKTVARNGRSFEPRVGCTTSKDETNN